MEEIFAIIGQFNREQQTTILLVDQNAQAALEVAHRGYVLEPARSASPALPPTSAATRR